MKAEDVPTLLGGLTPQQRIYELADQCHHAIRDAAKAVEACAEDPFTGLRPRIARADGAILWHLTAPAWIDHTHVSDVLQVVVNMCERWEDIAENKIKLREFDQETSCYVGASVRAAAALDNAISVLLLLSNELLPRG